MSFVDVAAVALTAVAMIGVTSPGGCAQLNPDPPLDARLRAGPLTVAPVIRIWNAGHDSNVFNRDSGSDPKGNTTLTASPSVAMWLRSRLIRATGYAVADLYLQRTAGHQSA